MHQRTSGLSRRAFLRWSSGLLGGIVLGPGLAPASPASPITRTIPSTGERIPVIGMGTWLTFAVSMNDAEALATRVAVFQAFFDRGGSVIDSSPMYGTSEQVIGYCLEKVRARRAAFAATKVWTRGRRAGILQTEQSRALWGVERFDLMQIHNLLDWETHLETLQHMKAGGDVRYLGITTSHGRRHAELEQALATVPFDFVQFTYNILDREAEQRLLPLASERGTAVLVNRPFRRGGLFSRVRGKLLPDWANEIDCDNWAQFFLKFVVSHPAVTCVIPATSRVDHMRQNMGAGDGRLPDPTLRRRMIEYVENL